MGVDVYYLSYSLICMTTLDVIRGIVGKRVMWQTLNGYASGQIVCMNEYTGVYTARCGGRIATVYPKDIVRVF